MDNLVYCPLCKKSHNDRPCCDDCYTAIKIELKKLLLGTVKQMEERGARRILSFIGRNMDDIEKDISAWKASNEEKQ